MTILEFKDAPSDEQELGPPLGLTVKCSWCGEIIRMDGQELALAMCQTCYQQMLAEFLRTQRANHAPSRPSDR